MIPKATDCDFLIIGGGIMGISIADHLIKKNQAARIIVLEKEPEVAVHASGRNSGVLHAGFYYTTDSLKARFTKEGNLRLTNYCEEKAIPILKCGKLIVAQCEQDLSQIDELLKRAEKNQVELHEISEKEAKVIEPNVRFYKRVLWSPTTSVVNPKLVMSQKVKDVQKTGVQVCFDTHYSRRRSSSEIETNRGVIKYQYLINCAGLYADKIALDFGFSKEYRLLPFKGLYLKSSQPIAGFLKTNIYPVPDLKNPFLGVHFTQTIDGHTKIGPTAIPAFWRENYKGFERFSLAEFLEIFYLELGLLANSNFNFLSLAQEEFKKYNRSYLLSLAEKMVTSIDKTHFKKWGPAGIRAQLFNIETRKLEMDYVYQGDAGSFHVLNAVSPAFTSSLPFSEYLCDKIEELRGIL